MTFSSYWGHGGGVGQGGHGGGAGHGGGTGQGGGVGHGGQGVGKGCSKKVAAK